MYIDKVTTLFFGPEDGPNLGAGDDTGETIEVNDELNDDSETIEDGDDEEVLEEISEQQDDENNEEDEEEESSSKPKKKKVERSEKEKDENEENLGDDSPVTGNVVKQAAKEFKGLFTKYPDLRKNFFFARDIQQYFGSVEEAKAATETISNFEAIVNEIDSGDPGSIVKYVGQNKDKLYKFGRKFLNEVLESNPDVFPHLTGPYIAQILKNAERDAKAAGNKNLEASVQHIAEYIFGMQGKIPNDPGLPEDRPVDDGTKKLREQQFSYFAKEVVDAGENNLKSYVENSLATLKTNKPGIKKMLAREMMSAIDQLMTKDTAHMNRMGSMWNKAKKGILTPQHRAAIINAHADAIKKLLPEVRAKVLKENGFTVKKVNKNKESQSLVNNEGSADKQIGRKNASGKRDVSNLSAAERLALYSNE